MLSLYRFQIKGLPRHLTELKANQIQQLQEITITPLFDFHCLYFIHLILKQSKIQLSILIVWDSEY